MGLSRWEISPVFIQYSIDGRGMPLGCIGEWALHPFSMQAVFVGQIVL